MPFNDKPQVFASSINALTFGPEGKSVTLGGSNVCPLYSFDAPLANPPRVGIEVSDKGFDPAIPGLAEFYAGCGSVVERAKKAASAEGADFVALYFESADPNNGNTSSEDCAKLAKEVAEAIDKPLVIMGCKNIEKDSDLFVKVAEALQGQNTVLLSAKEEDYKSVGAGTALAYGQNVGAESAVDINLAKQLNVLMTQLSVPAGKVVMNLGSAAAGYGFEYLASTMDRVKSAALMQDDKMLQMPVVTPVGDDAWGVKEALLEENEMPAWGAREERGIQMEIATASACLACGSDAVILRHPQSVKTVSELVSALM